MSIDVEIGRAAVAIHAAVDVPSLWDVGASATDADSIATSVQRSSRTQGRGFGTR